jgi:putative endonuclease
VPSTWRDLPSGTGDFWIYILTNERRTVLYIGLTSDPIKRISEHRLGENSSFTQRYRLDTLIYYENFPDPRDAIAREKQLKRWSREKKEILIARMNPEWKDLGEVILADGAQVAPGPSTVLRPPPAPALRFARDDRNSIPPTL